MPPRVTALLLAVILAWFGFIAGPGLSAPSSQAAEDTSAAQLARVESASGPAQGGTVGGSVQLDGQAVQVDPFNELAGLLPAPLQAPGPVLSTVRPHAGALASRRPPYLDGPLRPPCAVSLFA